MAAPATSQVAVAAVGAFSPLGATWAQTCASIRAGLSRLADHPYYEALTHDPEWDEADPLRCAMVPGWEESLDEPERLGDLAAEAMRDLVQRIPLKRADLGNGGVMLTLPEERDFPGAVDAATGVLARLLERGGLEGLAVREARAGGAAGFFASLREAGVRIGAGELAFCIVGGADTYFLDRRLEALDQAWRLRTLRNPDGFLPGEAAVVLLLASPRWLASAGMVPLCTLGEVGLGREPEAILGDRASSGVGLSSAIEAALGGGGPPAWVLCDLNGEAYRAFEWGLVQARLGPLLGDVRRITHPADCLGDVGAATGPLLVACAAHAFSRGDRPQGPTLLWASAEDGTRVATVASPPQGGKG